MPRVAHLILAPGESHEDVHTVRYAHGKSPLLGHTPASRSPMYDPIVSFEGKFNE
jgi:hypothetical protein